MNYPKFGASFCVLVFVLFFTFFLVAPTHAAGSLAINEIMYDPSGSDTNREWIEVYNTSATAIDLSKIFLLTDGLASSHHALVAQGQNSIDPGSYAVIVQNVDSFKNDYPAYTGSIFDSSWSGLTANVGKTLVLIDAQSTPLDQVTYDPTIGATNDGNSLQKTSTGSWVAALPTPGTSTTEETTDTNDETTTDTTTTSTTADTPTTSSSGNSGGANGSGSNGTPIKTAAVKQPQPQHMQATLSVPKKAIAGVPVSIGTTVFGQSGDLRTYGTFRYALGDGTAYTSSFPESFSHVYTFPGSYVISFEYRSNYYSTDPEITARATIEVSAAAIIISSVSSDGAIEITNTGMTEANLSNWIIREHANPSTLPVFHIPTGTIILPGKSITIGASATGFSGISAETIELDLPSGALSALYPEPVAPTPVEVDAPTEVVLAQSKNIDPTPTTPLAAEEQPTSIEKVSSDALSANASAALSTGADTSASTTKHSVIPFFVALLGIIVIAGIALRKFDVLRKNSTEDTSITEPESETKAIADTIRIIE